MQLSVLVRLFSNMTGCKNGVATRLLAEESRALLTHCYSHALNLAVSDAIKQFKVCCDALYIAFEVSKLIRFSPKRNAAFNRIKVENLAEEEPGPSNNIRYFSPTRWTVHGDAIESIIDNFDALKKLWEECLETKLDPDVKGRIIHWCADTDVALQHVVSGPPHFSTVILLALWGGDQLSRPKYYYVTYNGRPTFHGLPTPLRCLVFY